MSLRTNTASHAFIMNSVLKGNHVILQFPRDAAVARLPQIPTLRQNQLSPIWTDRPYFLQNERKRNEVTVVQYMNVLTAAGKCDEVFNFVVRSLTTGSSTRITAPVNGCVLMSTLLRALSHPQLTPTSDMFFDMVEKKASKPSRL
ncbi:unnamed protein product [Haemonchus placei]|uniref:Ras-GAP domain-containing protein n=1 Tax=Haemonchus placei TaxID=6290 RepID=A0A0N4X564_HAEPC|nr:unnamed protein product [Haemonchus placei]